MRTPTPELRTTTPVGGEVGGGGGASLWRRVTDLLVADPVPNFAVGLAIVIGFFHGWMKLQWRHPITTFAFDIPLVVALVWVLPRMRSLAEFFPASRAGRMMVSFYAVVGLAAVLSLVLPGAAPLVVALAAVRTWVFPTLMFGLGFQIVRSRRQLHGYFILILILSALTALYSTQQTEEEVRALQAMDPYYEFRTRGQGFVSDSGQWVLRRFSTFISSGAFGGTMSVALLLAVGLLTDRSIRAVERAVLVAMAALICWGMVLSGARSALLGFVFGMVLVVWYRRVTKGLVLAAGLLVVGMVLGAITTKGGTLSRYTSLDWETVVGRVWIVVAPGWRYLVDSGFIGGGLGRSAGGLPAFLFPLLREYDFWGVDGDLGRTAAELGLPGIFVVTMMLWAGLRDGFSVLQRNRENLVGTLALGAMSCFSVAALTFPTGSPFLGIPIGVLTWFFLGAALRVDREETVPLAAAAAAATSTAKAKGTPGNRGDPGEAASPARVPEASPAVVAPEKTASRDPVGARSRAFMFYNRATAKAGQDSTAPIAPPPASSRKPVPASGVPPISAPAAAPEDARPVAGGSQGQGPGPEREREQARKRKRKRFLYS